MNLDVLKKEQEVYIKGIYDAVHEPVDNPLESDSIIRNISSRKDFNKFWFQLYSNFSHLDLEHPDMKNIFNFAFSGEFSKLSNQMFELMDICKEKNFSADFITGLYKVLTKRPEYQEMESCFNFSGKWSSTFLRFFKEEERLAGRSCKSMQPVDLTLVYKKKINDLWKTQPDNFLSYRRFYLLYQEELANLEKKMDSFRRIGCNFLADEMKINIDAFLASQPGFYYGFNRIKLSIAAVILAKVNRFNYIPVDEPIYSPSSIFFHADKSLLGKIVRHREACEPGDSQSEYTPRYYTHLEALDFDLKCNPDMIKLIDFLDHFPPLMGKPLFDHYRVLVPGIKDQKHKDKHLIDKELVCPILIGERDNSCFFISYWI
jgi:hypothetical protein